MHFLKYIVEHLLPVEAHLNLARGFGEGCKFPQQEQQTQNNLLNMLTNTTYFGETIPLTPPLEGLNKF